MRQMVEEITFSRYPIESAMFNNQVPTRSTVAKWLERARQEEHSWASVYLTGSPFVALALTAHALRLVTYGSYSAILRANIRRCRLLIRLPHLLPRLLWAFSI